MSPSVLIAEQSSIETPAQRDSIGDWDLGNLDAGISGKDLVHFQREKSDIYEAFAHVNWGWTRNRSSPESVVVGNHSPDLHQIDQPLVIVQIVLFVRIHERKIERSVHLPLHNSTDPLNLLIC